MKPSNDLLECLINLSCFGSVTIAPFIEENEDESQYKVTVYSKYSRRRVSRRCVTRNLASTIMDMYNADRLFTKETADEAK